ncbi:MAG: MFS transporter [Melioribacter sp.]|uniref:MFS transporter n=1 Tax=Rosettibacter primus TaxID=3111523 RepID=UPI00247DF6A6|nr:MFS transporter [Melioribacter sp.]
MKKKIPRAVVILGLISFFTDFASEMLYPITPFFLTSVLGSSMTVVGLIEGIAEVTAGLLKGYFGALSDKLRKRSIFVTIGYGISGIVKPLPGILPYISTVIFSRVTDRIGKGIRTAPRDALLSSYSTDNNSGSIFGFHRAMDTLGAVAGPLAAISLLKIYPENYKLIFILAFIPSVFAIAFTLFVKDVPAKSFVNPKNILKNFWKTSPKNYKIILFLLTIFSIVNSSDVFLILRSKNISHSDTTAIMGYIFYNIIYALSSYPVGNLSDRFGKKKIFATGLFIFSIVYFVFAFNTKPFVIWICFALYGIYAASTEGIAKAWISDIIDVNFRGSAIGLLTTLMSLGVMCGSIITGFLWDKFGASIPFLISSIVSLIIAFTIIIWKKI